jgi:hypothetical protein
VRRPSPRRPLQPLLGRPLPWGYHRIELRTASGLAGAHILAARRAFRVSGRVKGAFLPLYSLASQEAGGSATSPTSAASSAGRRKGGGAVSLPSRPSSTGRSIPASRPAHPPLLERGLSRSAPPPGFAKCTGPGSSPAPVDFRPGGGAALRPPRRLAAGDGPRLPGVRRPCPPRPRARGGGGRAVRGFPRASRSPAPTPRSGRSGPPGERSGGVARALRAGRLGGLDPEDRWLHLWMQ